MPNSTPDMLTKRQLTFTTVACAVVLGIFFLGRFATIPSSEALVDDLKICIGNDRAVVSCAPPIITELMQDHSAAETMQILAGSLSTRECHVIGHTVGQVAYQKSHSVEKALGECDATCGAACIHGAIGQAFMEASGIVAEDVDFKHLSTADI
jgi:hypothetical protein